MTRIATLMTLVFGVSAGAALAEVMVVDADENGTFSYIEMAAAYPNLTEDLFGQIDADADGEVSAEELQAAAEAGMLPK
ncbi:MAG: EF-hand domain-containing protein [Cognatishimia sp.]